MHLVKVAASYSPKCLVQNLKRLNYNNINYRKVTNPHVFEAGTSEVVNKVDQ